tara:strand:- start:50 stop:589 length:540 start_codon:yes stop_codon:yes gene_type:complete
MLIEKGWVKEAQKIPSSNYEDRPSNTSIDLLVIHCISLPPGQFGTGDIDDFFQNKLNTKKHEYFRSISSLKVSSHFLIERSGSLKQYVSTEKKAWHAGVSSFKGEENCNDFSIGIELEGTENTEYEKVQYNILVELIAVLMKKYPNISKDRIVGHSEIAPRRKKDPGIKFDWKFIKSKI